MNWVFLDITPWDYDVSTPLVRPLGGSQSALCYLARALASRGDNVTTLTGTKTPREIDGVHCLHHEGIPAEVFAPHDTIVVVLNGPADAAPAIRDPIPPGRPLLLWMQHAHNQPANEPLRDAEIAATWDRVVCISDWQRSMFEQELGVPAKKIEVLRNAISPAFENMFSSAKQLTDAKAGELRLAYTSTPFRGLDILMACFPVWHRRHPHCRLDVYSSMEVYGHSKERDEFKPLYAQCEATPGIVYRGSISQSDLAKELRGATMLTYPNTFAETGCIAAMEALASGLFVVSSDLGALPETCGGWAQLIPPIGTSRTLEQFAVDFARHVDHTLTELQSDRQQWMQRRFQQVQAMNETCTWKLRAEQWQQAAQQWLSEQ